MALFAYFTTDLKPLLTFTLKVTNLNLKGADMKEFEVELSATTYRTFYVTAESAEQAEELVWEVLDNDEEISGAWKDNAKLESVEPCQ